MTSLVIEKEVVRLLGARVASIDRIVGGGNSRVYRVTDTAGNLYALKSYPSLAQDPRDRLGTEFSALSFLANQPDVVVPRPITFQREHLIAIYSWIDGVRPAVSISVIDAMLRFMNVVYGLRGIPAAANIPLAIESCISGAEILRQIVRRFVRLRKVENEPSLQIFLTEEVAPMLAKLSLDDYELPKMFRCLNPGDFGVHNMLSASGRMAFVDFEYFGWDDPCKQICDVLWHPAMNLEFSLARRFLKGAAELYGENDNGLAGRVCRFLPAYGLRWVMIILNEFLPDRWAARVHAGADDHEKVKKQQLDKAREIMQNMNNRVTMASDTLLAS